MAHLVLVHGVGGDRPEDEWVTPLNLGLQFLGYDPVAAPSDSVTVVSYQVVETATTTREPPVTYVAPEEEERLKLELAYIARRAELERRVRIHADHGMGLGGVPFADGAPMARAAEYVKFSDVRLYIQRIATARDVWAQVLGQFPNEGHMIVVAHSLGSVVTADVLRRLPPAVTVDLLVTIGSPLAFQRYRKYSANLGSNFPYGRVHRWLNVYESNDLVTAGRGIAGAIPQALDVGVDLGTTHTLKAYMSHPAVAEAIGFVMFGEPAPAAATRGRDPARRLHDSWHTLLLSTAYSLQVANSLPKDDWKARASLMAARKEVAERAVTDIAEQARIREAGIAELREAGYSAPADIDDHPLAAGRYPNYRDLTVGAAAELAERWTDPELLPLAVVLLMQPIVPPFDITVDESTRTGALSRTLNVIRKRGSNLPDQGFTDQVRSSVAWATRKLGDKGFPWGKVLIGAGVVALAATGIGLVAAAPAGLAGAAVITATLAGFGPGGMVGGLVTIASLTGTGVGATAAGATRELGDASARRAAAAAVRHSGGSLAGLDLGTLRATLVSLIAVVHAQKELGFDSSALPVRAVLASGRDIANAEHRIHASFAPDGASTKDWARKEALFDKAITVIEDLAPTPEMTDLARARKAVESGKLPT